MPVIREPGKFEGELHLCKALYELTLDGGADEEVGEAQYGGWYGLMTGVDLSDLIDAGKEAGISEKNIREDFGDVVGRSVLRGGQINAILHENDQGFVECEFYEGSQRAREEFERISHDIAVESGEEEPYEPQEGDWATEDHVTFWEVGGTKHRPVCTISEAHRGSDEAMWRSLERCMKSQNFFPNVWFLSDHGNYHLMTRPEKKRSTKGLAGRRHGNRCRASNGQFARCR